MYLLNVSYTSQPENVQQHAQTHSAWVTKYIESGVFLFAGPKKSKLGGVLLAKSMDKSALMEILQEDSYVQNDLVEYQIIDFDCKLLSSKTQIIDN